MTGKVTRLPDSMQRQWRVYEEALGAELQIAGCQQDEINHVLTVLKPAYLNYAKPNKFYGDAETVLQELSDWVKDVTGGLLIALAMKELELYRVYRNASSKKDRVIKSQSTKGKYNMNNSQQCNSHNPFMPFEPNNVDEAVFAEDVMRVYRSSSPAEREKFLTVLEQAVEQLPKTSL